MNMHVVFRIIEMLLLVKCTFIICELQSFFYCKNGITEEIVVLQMIMLFFLNFLLLLFFFILILLRIIKNA